MSDGALRGMRIGAHTVQGDGSVDELEPRREHRYRCEAGHEMTMIFAADADAPHSWTCRTCGADAVLFDGGRADSAEEEDNARTPRTHWDMLLERRSRDELQELLDERIAYLHERRRLAREEQLKQA